MPAAKTAAAPAVRPTEKPSFSRATRIRRAPANVDSLANDLDRVLKVSQPKADRPPPKRTTTSAAVKGKQPMPPKEETKPTATVLRRGRVVSTKPTSKAVEPPAPNKRAAAGTSAKPKSAPAPELERPWATSGFMSAQERLKAAQTAINDALRALAEALQVGFKYSAPKPNWSCMRAECTVESGRLGLRVLRELCETNPSARLSVQRGVVNLASRLVCLEMYTHALSILVENKPHALKLYGHDEDVAGPSSVPPPLEPEWVTLAVFPPPTGDIDETTRTVLSSFILAAWCCLLSMPLTPEAVLACFQLKSNGNPLHPVTLAPQLPLSAVGSQSVYLYRLAKDDLFEEGSPAWLRIRHISAFASALCASGASDPKTSPDRVWSSVRRTVTAHIGRGDDAKREAAEYIGFVVNTVETIWRARGEPRVAWFGGVWPAVVDIWTGLGRQLSDSQIIDDALAAATAGARLSVSSSTDGSVSSLSASPASTPPSSVPSRSATPPTTKIPDAAKVVTRMTVELAKTLVEVSADDVSQETFERGLAQTPLVPFCDALCSLDASGSKSLAMPASQGIERLRRVVVKALGVSALEASATAWLLEYTTFIDSVLAHIDSPATIARISLSGLTDAASALMKKSSTALPLDRLDGIYATLQAYSCYLDMAIQEQHAACLIQATYALGMQLSRSGSYADAVELCRRSCVWSQTFIAQHSPPGEMAQKYIVAPLGKRYELLGYCLQNNGASGSALKAYCQSCLCLDAQAVAAIDAEAGRKPLRAVLEPLTYFNNAILRVVALLSREVSLETEVATVLSSELGEKQWSPAVNGAILEAFIAAIEPIQFKPRVQGVLTALMELALEVYDETYPIRRMRTIGMYMSVITSAGGSQERFDSLKLEADRLYSLDSPGNDAELVKFKQEYYASVQILLALQTYHHTESSTIVAELGRAAMDASSRFILRSAPAAKAAASARGAKAAPARRKVTPTRSATRKVSGTAAKAVQAKATAAEPAAAPLVLDDAERFSQLLSSLASLFGLLGYVVPKIEALNLLRALQRSLQDMGDSYIRTSALVASEYGRLGKHSRASLVFAKAIRHANDTAIPVSPAARTELHLRYSYFLASSGQVAKAIEQFAAAQALYPEIPAPSSSGTIASRWIQVSGMAERIALAHAATAAIKMAEADVTAAIASLVIAYRQWCRAAHNLANIATVVEVAEEETPASSPAAELDEACKAEKKKKSKPFCYEGKRLGGLQWYIAEALFEATFSLSLALAQRGSVKECEYYLKQARGMVASVRSSTLDARTSSRSAEFETRRLKFEKTVEELEHATAVLTVDGPDAVDIQRIKGELFSRQQEAPAADEMFATAVEHIVGLDKAFMSAESRMPSARKDSLAPGSKEPLLPVALGHLLRQRAWLLREAGCDDEYDAVLEQLEHVPRTSGGKGEQLLLEARVSMNDAFKYFKTDLFMSSLPESTIAMTMGLSAKRGKERHSTRHEATLQLERASVAFRRTLANVARTGRVEDVRQACVSLALLGAYQTSLGHGSSDATAAAAGTLASIASITLHRELLPAIDSKYPNPAADDFDWPQLNPSAVAADDSMGSYWKDVRAKEAACDYLHCDYDLSSVPTNWAVVSITVTDDRNTMLVTRHQNGHEPIVFCIPLDRQGKREGEDESELFTFDTGVADLKAIMAGNDASIKSIKTCQTNDDRRGWWKGRHELDERLGALLGNMEFCWLGAFKTVLNPRLEFDPEALANFRKRLDRIFHAALSGGGRNSARVSRVRLDDTLLACFATLSSQCREEELEDLVYFVLDLYQSHGIAVALAELDFDQMGIDVKAALADFEAATGAAQQPESDEHLLLVLDKNVQAFPWESIPILRGRAVSRIPSLPFLLDQVELGKHLGGGNGGGSGHRTVDARRTRYFLNPGGDLTNTQKQFEDRMDQLEPLGWRGVTGRKPTEDEMCEALSTADMVMYYGHGGGEEYVRAHKVRALRKCAVTMLWGCSSGALRDQGDFDCAGTPCDYVLAGAPCLVANLWDVTDKDIDRITNSVMDSLGLDSAHLGSSDVTTTSVVQAVSKSRAVAKLQYLTGAAPVVYGIPVYMASTA